MNPISYILYYYPLQMLSSSWITSDSLLYIIAVYIAVYIVIILDFKYTDKIKGEISAYRRRKKIIKRKKEFYKNLKKGEEIEIDELW